MILRAMKPCDANVSAQILASAFASDPLMEWYFRPPNQSLINEYMRLAVDLTQVSQSNIVVEVDGRVVGCCLALPPGKTTISFTSIILKIFKRPKILRWDILSKYWKVATYFETIQPTQSHWYIFLIAVLPEFQGGGLGKVMIEWVKSEAKKLQMPIYLETFEEKNLNLYGRVGFCVIKHSDKSQSVPLESWAMVCEQVK